MNELTAEAVRLAEQDIRNAQRLNLWAIRWERRTGRAPVGYVAACRRLMSRLSGVAAEPVESPASAAIYYIHPSLLSRSRERHGNQNVVRFPRRRRQIMHARMPEPPEAA